MHDESIVFTNGVFDLIHRGHISLLKYCRSLGGRVVVAIDSDARVKETKGEFRPINGQEDRKLLLESIRYVDRVVIFNSKEELWNLHRLLKPQIFVKGSDWSSELLRETDGILTETRIVAYPFVDTYSSTDLLRKIRSLPTSEKLINGDIIQ
jgi:D-beta-D-heptose 7-phosphate kinase/D-beta-D-heptose 1-phosphate adenosyltransferase